MPWRSGDVILWREVWHGNPWLVMPVRVVDDRQDLLALHLAEGTALGFPAGSWPWEDRHPWNDGSGDSRWRGHGVLTLHRPGTAHAIWVFWRGEMRTFSGWYVNLAAPFQRTSLGIDTLDHELDIRIDPDGTWALKDEELLDGEVELGRWTEDEAAAIRAEGARIAASIENGKRWWDDAWASWQPDPSWTALELPPGWDSR
jgi:Protein of unknown function (DUF402)